MEKATSFLTARRLHECRLASGETLEQVAALVGVNKTTVMRWENGNTSRISRPALDLLARHFGVTAAWLEGEKGALKNAASGRWIEEHALPYGALSEVPLLGSVRAGYGGAVFEEITGYEPAPASSLQRDEAYFWLTVTGDSMEPILCEGDLVLVRKQTSVDNGSMAVVLVGGEEGLVKKIFYGPDWIELHSLNPAYAVRRFEGPDVMQVAVLGLVMESKRKFI